MSMTNAHQRALENFLLDCRSLAADQRYVKEAVDYILQNAFFPVKNPVVSACLDGCIVQVLQFVQRLEMEPGARRRMAYDAIAGLTELGQYYASLAARLLLLKEEPQEQQQTLIPLSAILS